MRSASALFFAALGGAAFSLGADAAGGFFTSPSSGAARPKGFLPGWGLPRHESVLDRHVKVQPARGAFVTRVHTYSSLALCTEAGTASEKIKTARGRDTPGIPAEQQRIIFGGKQLSGADKQLSDFELEEGNTLHLVLRLRGGPEEDVPSPRPSARPGLGWFGWRTAEA
ncbi:unnamed protein product [Scytosiphon promiscuus]